jgi:PAS domain S-box-containing protein
MATAARANFLNLPDGLAQTIVNDLMKPILVLDRDLRIAFANRCFCDWVGLSWKEVDGRPLEHFLNNPVIPDFIRETQLGSAMLDFQAECNIPGVGSRDLLLRVHPLGPAHPLAVFIGLANITDHKVDKTALTLKVEAAERAQIALRNRAHLLQSIIMESSGDGIGVLDVKGYCVLWNPACEKMLGLKPGNIRFDEWPKHFGLYLPDKTTLFPAEDLPLSRALNGESCDEVEVWVINEARPEGLWVSVTGRPLTGGEDGAVAAFRDITFAKNAKEVLAIQAAEISRSNRELEHFAYIAAHDLQEPLRMVSSYVQLLSRRYKGKLDAEADEFIGFAVDGSKRMSMLINDLLHYSRIGQGDAAQSVVDCQTVLEQVLFSSSRKNQAAEAMITHDCLPRIRGNELQITQIFQNLVDNAVKFRGSETARVHISARADGAKWIFSVADNGIGIEPQYSERIFVLFQRLNAREDYAGTGIGLAVCKRIVEKQGGRIWVEPNKEKGTIVSFTWPLDSSIDQGGKNNA